jgi:hypothetical protein
MTMTPGEKVEWLYRGPRRLYSLWPVGIVLRVSPRTVHIQVQRSNGQTRRHWVKQTAVRPLNRQEATHDR